MVNDDELEGPRATNYASPEIRMFCQAAAKQIKNHDIEVWPGFRLAI
jgi:hypothetical protein